MMIAYYYYSLRAAKGGSGMQAKKIVVHLYNPLMVLVFLSEFINEPKSSLDS
jgi:hypothetical protein